MPHVDEKYIDSSNSAMYNLRYIEKYISYILIDIMKNGRQNSIAKGDDY